MESGSDITKALLYGKSTLSNTPNTDSEKWFHWMFHDFI